jgi:transposase
MNKNKQIYGVDISKNVFDVVDSQGNYYQFKNDGNGFKLFLKILLSDYLVVMEATGYCFYRLAQFLYE